MSLVFRTFVHRIDHQKHLVQSHGNLFKLALELCKSRLRIIPAGCFVKRLE